MITAANFCMNGKLAVVGTYDGRCIFYETEVSQITTCTMYMYMYNVHVHVHLYSLHVVFSLMIPHVYVYMYFLYFLQHLKYHTQIHVRSRHGKNRGRKISGIVPLPGEEDKVSIYYTCT